MSYWLREIAGWLLVASGIGVFIVCFNLLFETNYVNNEWVRTPQVIQVGPLSIIGIVLFRGGIHLLKVAVAARICWQAQANLQVDKPRAAPNPVVTARPVTARRP